MSKYCPYCGRELSDGALFCVNCGKPVSNIPKPIKIHNGNGLTCPRCGSQNISVQIEQVSSKTIKHGNGFGGIANNTARGMTAMCTFGISNLFWKKSKGTESAKIKKSENLHLSKPWKQLENIKWPPLGRPILFFSYYRHGAMVASVVLGIDKAVLDFFTKAL